MRLFTVVLGKLRQLARPGLCAALLVFGISWFSFAAYADQVIDEILSSVEVPR